MIDIHAMENERPGIIWVSANEVVEAQTRAIERTFKSSQPKPRNWAMGFTGRDEDDDETIPGKPGGLVAQPPRRSKTRPTGPRAGR